MVSAKFTIDGTAAELAFVPVAAGASVPLAIIDIAGINSVVWECVGTHGSAVAPSTITAAIVAGGIPNGVTATLTMPAGLGQAYLLQATATHNDGNKTTIAKGKVVVLNANGDPLAAANETLEHDPVNGWTELINNNIGAAADIVSPTELIESQSRNSGYSIASLPRLFKKLEQFNEITSTGIKIVGMGSSVGNGATLASPSTDAPVAKFKEFLEEKFDKLNYLSVTFSNESVDGTTLTDGVSIIDAVLAAENPDVMVLVYGMNDGATAQYNGGQAYPFVYKNLQIIIDKCRAADCDVVIMTTPHPHPDRVTWSMPIGVPQQFPEFIAADVGDEALTPPVSTSIRSVDYLGDGANLDVAYRYLRTNQAMRRVAIDAGCALIDVERDWFVAVKANGNDNLYDIGEFVHPNQAGHENSYWIAMEKFMDAVSENFNHGVQQNNLFTGPVGVNAETPAAEIDVIQTDATRDILRCEDASADVRLLLDSSGDLRSEKGSQFFGDNVVQTFDGANAATKTSDVFRFVNVGVAQNVPIPAKSVGVIWIRGFQNGIGDHIEGFSVMNINAGGTVTLSALTGSNQQTGGAVFTVAGSGDNVAITPVAGNTNLSGFIEFGTSAV